MTRAVVLLRPLPLEERLRPPVSRLLLPVGAHGVAPVVPDHGAGVEAQGPALLAEPPADVHVVARRTELGIESPDGLEGDLPERHVAAGDVLGFPVREE